MPFDAARWSLEIAAIDRTAGAFDSAKRRMREFSQASAAVGKQTADSFAATGVAAKAGAAAFVMLRNAIAPLAAAVTAAALADKVWSSGMKAADLGEQAEQIGINTDQLQAYRLAGAQAGVETEQMDTAITKLAKSMGAAADGNKEMIERFQQLGVNLLDAQGELRPVADVLPEVAKGVLNIGSSSQRTATLMDLFGRSGAKMTTVLKDLAAGNAAVIAAAREKNAIISPEAIEAWDNLADRMKVTQVRWEALAGEFGAKIALPAIEHLNGLLESTKKELEGIQSIWKWIMANMDAAKRAEIRARAAPEQADVKNLQDRLDALRQNPTQFGFKASEKALMDQLAARQEAARRAEALVNQSLFDFEENNARRDKLPGMYPPLGVTDGGTTGSRNPAAKSGGGTDPYAKLIADARQYIAAKKAETEGIGLNADAAARLKHETELLGKATAASIALTPQVTAEFKQLAAAMAAADAALASAKFMDDAAKKSAEFIAAQEIEQQTLWMSAEAADAYRIAQEYLNAAKAQGITLSTADTEKLREQAALQAAASQKTREAKEIYDLARSSFVGLVTDVRQGLIEGKNAWDVFGNAGLNALDRLSAKLFEMAATKVFEQAFGGSSGGGAFLGGVFGAIGRGIGSLFGSGVSGGLGGGSGITFADGGNYPAGVPRIVGERGWELDIPSRGGTIYNQRQLAEMLGGSARIVIQIAADSDWVRATARDESGRMIAVAGPQIESRAVDKANRAAPSVMERDRAERGGDYRT